MVRVAAAKNRQAYDPGVITRHQLGSALWIDVVDATDEELEQLDTQYGIDDRTFDEARRRSARPTLQRHHDHAYIVAFSGSLAEIDMYIGDGWFITVRRHDPDEQEWDPSTAIARASRFTRSQASPGLMLAMVIEELVDGYFDSTDMIEDRIEAIEDRIFQETLTTEGQVQHDLFAIRRDLMVLRRAVMPLREVLQAILRQEVPWVNGEALTIIRDTFDKLLRAVDIVDEMRELLGNAVDAHLAVMSNQMNLVMKQLTAWGSIVFGATLIAGIYGMNFEHMPELAWYYGYPLALGSMVVLSLFLFRIFKRRNWL